MSADDGKGTCAICAILDAGCGVVEGVALGIAIVSSLGPVAHLVACNEHRAKIAIAIKSVGEVLQTSLKLKTTEAP